MSSTREKTGSGSRGGLRDRERDARLEGMLLWAKRLCEEERHILFQDAPYHVWASKGRKGKIRRRGEEHERGNWSIILAKFTRP